MHIVVIAVAICLVVLFLTMGRKRTIDLRSKTDEELLEAWKEYRKLIDFEEVGSRKYFKFLKIGTAIRSEVRRREQEHPQPG